MNATTSNLLKAGVLGTAVFTAMNAQAVTLGTFDNTTVKVGGYIKLDVLYTSYDDPYVGIGRDFYVPSTTPVPAAGAGNSQSYFDMHARQTRFHIGTDTKAGDTNIKTYIEMDFQVTAGGDERISNSYAPRLRHAFIKTDNWLFGQTWSTFQDVKALPETVDFIGNTDAGIFIRQPMVRYMNSGFEIAIENPESTVTDTTNANARLVTEDSTVPDLVARYTYKTDGMHLTGAVLARQITMDQAGVDSTVSGLGLSFTGKIMVGKDDIRFGINSGSGMGRYIGLNVANGAYIDANGELEAIDSTGIFASYRHHWNDKWRSNVTYSQIDIDNDAFLGTGVTKGTYSARVNLMVAAAKNLTYGAEIALASRELENGDEGDMSRFQFMAKYAF